MIRKPLTIFSLIGLLLSVGLWGASYFWFYAYWGESRVDVFMGRLTWRSGAMPRNTPLALGCLGFHGFHFERLNRSYVHYFAFPDRSGSRRLNRSYAPRNALPGRIGAKIKTADAQGLMSWGRTASILLWVPTLVFGILLCFCRPLYHRRRRKRKRLGLCVKCGYDLRGSQERCPECGTGFSI